MAMHFRSNLNLMSLRLRLMACCGAKQVKPSVKLQHFVLRLQNEHAVHKMYISIVRRWILRNDRNAMRIS